MKKKALFEIALAVDGIKMTEWARRHGVTHGAVSRYLSGDLVSRELGETIDLYIADNLRKAKIKVGARAIQ